MSTIKETIAQLFGKAQATDSIEQVSAQAVVAATELDPAEGTPAEETPAAEPAEASEPAEAPAATEVEAVNEPAATASPAASATMVSIEVSALAEIQRKATAYDTIHAEHAQLKAWHTNAQGSVGIGPDANMATAAQPKHVSAATRRAIEIAAEQAKYTQ